MSLSFIKKHFVFFQIRGNAFNFERDFYLEGDLDLEADFDLEWDRLEHKKPWLQPPILLLEKKNQLRLRMIKAPSFLINAKGFVPSYLHILLQKNNLKLGLQSPKRLLLDYYNKGKYIAVKYLYCVEGGEESYF